jgi:hypothetical protein
MRAWQAGVMRLQFCQHAGFAQGGNDCLYGKADAKGRNALH